MNIASNSFYHLHVDVDGDHLDSSSSDDPQPALELSKESTSSNDDKSMCGKQNAVATNNKKNNRSDSKFLNLPLVWIDLEMTGLDIEIDRILEIACIITDGSLNKTIEGPDVVVHQSKECMDGMGVWCQEHHSHSGLSKQVLESTLTEGEAEIKVIEFVKKNVGMQTPLLAGNSVYMDLLFIKKYMPDLAALFSHVLVDVSSVKALCIRWYPKEYKSTPRKSNKHRALDDIRESIKELKYYRQNIFKQSTQ